MPAAPPKGWDRYMPHEPWAPDHHLVPIVGGLISWFRGGGRAMLKTVRCSADFERARTEGLRRTQRARVC
jgi:hypothetical protein